MIFPTILASVWFIPGWLRTDSPREGILHSASNAFPAAKIEFRQWDGNNIVWPLAVDSADKESWRFAFEIATMPKERRENLTLVGHSLGGRIIARVLARLAENNIKIKQAILLGAAIPANDPDIAKMGGGSTMPVLAICNPSDKTLKYIYAAVGGEKGVAFGANGALKPSPNVIECVTPPDLTDQVDVEAAWGKLPVIKRIANHYEKFYIEYAGRLLAGEDITNEIMVPQGFLTVEGKVMDSGVFWDDIESFGGWKLEKNKLTGHCRIIDDKKTRHAWGLEEQMRQAFEKVKRQCKQPAK